MTTVPPAGTIFSTRKVRLSNSAATLSALCTVILIGLLADACRVAGEKCLFLIVTLTASCAAAGAAPAISSATNAPERLLNRCNIFMTSKFVFELRLADVLAEIGEVEMAARHFLRIAVHLMAP